MAESGAWQQRGFLHTDRVTECRGYGNRESRGSWAGTVLPLHPLPFHNRNHPPEKIILRTNPRHQQVSEKALASCLRCLGVGGVAHPKCHCLQEGQSGFGPGCPLDAWCGTESPHNSPALLCEWRQATSQPGVYSQVDWQPLGIPTTPAPSSPFSSWVS